jgi:NTP pyrophosphatase (non-canonical NTP hydrolase)
MEIAKFQDLIRKTYHRRDKKRGLDKNFLWLTEEVGELAEGVRKRDKKEIFEEAADVLAWLSTICSLSGVDLEEAALAKYGKG